jgi:hypothetical protein
MKTELSDKLVGLAGQLSYASEAKQAARVRSQCSLEEWSLVLAEAKLVYAQRAYAQRKAREAA